MSCVIWQHVRLAELPAGSTTVDCAANNNYQPRIANGGLISVQSLANFTEIPGMGGSYVVCSDAILGQLAKQIDLTLNDGVGSDGSIRVAVNGAAVSAGVAAPIDDIGYVVCM